MSGIECVNLLAFIQLLVTADFTLFFLDENGYLAGLYEKFIEELTTKASKTLKEASRAENRALKDLVQPAERKIIARMRSFIDRIKYLTGRAPDYDGWSMLGLYGGIYGVTCLVMLGIAHSRLDSYQKEFILVFAQITLFLQCIIIFRLMAIKNAYQRNVVRIVSLVVTALIMVAVIVYFDLKFDFFLTFENPFVIFSLLILFMPYIVAIIHIAISLLQLYYYIYRCRNLYARLDKGKAAI